MPIHQHYNEVFGKTFFAWCVFALFQLLLQIYHIVRHTTWAKIGILYCLYIIPKHFFLDNILQEGGDDSVDNLFNEPADEDHLAAEQEALEEAELEQRENLEEESAGVLADLSLST